MKINTGNTGVDIILTLLALDIVIIAILLAVRWLKENKL